MSDEEFLTWLENDCGYQRVKLLKDRPGFYAAVMPLFATHAIIVGEVGDTTGYSDRWCYDSRLHAFAYLALWDGTGEPKGWHRHPSSGRRIAQGSGEYNEHGIEVPIGEEYLRP